MNNRREQVWVGSFVLIAAALLLGTILAVAGTFSASGFDHHAYFKSAGGVMPGAVVRYGGMKAGKVSHVEVDSQDSTRIEIDFTISPEIPVKTDSVAKIASLGALGENYIEIGTGTKSAPLAPAGSELKSAETAGIGDIGDMMGNLAPVANQVLMSLDQRLTEMKITLARVNDLLNDSNRKSVNGSLQNLNLMLAENRPKVTATLTNVQDASAKITPLLDDLKTTMGQANQVLADLDSVTVANRQDIRAVVVQLKQVLLNSTELIEQLKNTTDINAENVDQMVENLRLTTENLKQMTDSLKSNPSLLIRGNKPKDRVPGGKAE
jgi:phospholipid/cholesterol/gamma-HCH transport system substrate-binding protein